MATAHAVGSFPGSPAGPGMSRHTRPVCARTGLRTLYEQRLPAAALAKAGTTSNEQLSTKDESEREREGEAGRYTR